VVLTYSVELDTEGGFIPGDRRFRLDKATETWRITVEQVALGGWKVSHIEVVDPIKVTDRGTTSGP
jgi:hypothetical protein